MNAIHHGIGAALQCDRWRALMKNHTHSIQQKNSPRIVFTSFFQIAMLDWKRCLRACAIHLLISRVIAALVA